MEKITSGLPPLSLPLYYHLTSDSPPNTPTLISPIRNPNSNLTSTVCINSQSIRFFLLLLYLFLSSHPFLSLYSPSYATPSQGFRLLRRSLGSQFLQFSLGAFHIPACCIIGLPCG